jgi:DNA modification methylase
MKTKTIKIAEYKHHPKNPNNPNTHPEHQLKELAKSLDRFSQVKNIVVWNGFFLAGHGLAMAAEKEGIEELVAVDVSEWDEQTAIEFMIADNRLPELSIIDNEMLTTVFNDLELPGDIPGVDIEYVNAILSTGPDFDVPFDFDGEWEEPPEPQIDKADELRQEYGVEVGQLWALGDHRLICGDCTDKEVVNRVMGGERSLLYLSDPPYGINRDVGFTGSGGFSGKGPIPRRQYGDVWDKKRPDKDTFFMHLSNTKSAIIFGGNYFADILPKSTHWIVWDKLNTMPSYGDCELLWTNINRQSVKKITYKYNGAIGKEKNRFHPTQKPVGLLSDILNEYSSENEIVLDCYLGSGTTLIACEQLNRQCRAIELEPKYVGVTIKRWEELTGEKAVLLETIGE